MKYLSSQLSIFLRERGVKRNLGMFFRFLGVLIFMVTLYSVLFHYIMEYEGRSYSWITGLYWTLTVMTTLGFGDITFTSDLGKLFSVLVLMTGVLCLLVMLPFAFIQYVYAPWLEAQKKRTVPRSIPSGVKGHIIVVGVSPVALDLAGDLARYGFYCVLLSGDAQGALDLLDQGYHVVVGDYDDGAVYQRLNLGEAAMLTAMDNDVRNTNIIFSAREVDAKVPIVARAERTESIDILYLAGASRVFQFRTLLGEALARRVHVDRSRCSVLTEFGPLLLAEASAKGSFLAGKTIRDSELRRTTGVNIVGLWERGRFLLPQADTLISEETVLVMAGTASQIANFDMRMRRDAENEAETASDGPVLVLGGGRVGLAAARSLRGRGLNVVIVDRREVPAGEGVGFVKGDAADLAVLESAGIRAAPSVIITTHDDDTNIYLTIYCRRLRPDMQIISRATLDRNVGILHSAGADLVLSLVSMMSDAIVNMLSPGRVFMLSEGLNLFRVCVGQKLLGKSLASSNIRRDTGCSVVAVRGKGGQMLINPDPQREFQAGDNLYLIGDSGAESAFYERYGHEGCADQKNGEGWSLRQALADGTDWVAREFSGAAESSGKDAGISSAQSDMPERQEQQ